MGVKVDEDLFFLQGGERGISKGKSRIMLLIYTSFTMFGYKPTDVKLPVYH